MAAFATMARLTLFLCMLSMLACADNPYVIGLYRTDAAPPVPPPDGNDAGDAGVDECATTYATALVCSGFEEGDIESAWSDTVLDEEGELALSDDEVHSGEAALLASSDGPMSRAAVLANFPARRSGQIYMRAYAFVAPDQPTNIMNIFFVGDDTRNNDRFEGVDFNIEQDALQAFLPLHDPSRFTSDITIPRGQWFCFRARVGLDDEDGEVEAYIDDVLALDLDGLDTVPEGGVRQFRAGIDWSSEQEERFEVFIDDVVVDTSPVTCR